MVLDLANNEETKPLTDLTSTFDNNLNYLGSMQAVLLYTHHLCSSNSMPGTLLLLVGGERNLDLSNSPTMTTQNTADYAGITPWTNGLQAWCALNTNIQNRNIKLLSCVLCQSSQILGMVIQIQYLRHI